MKTIIEFVKKEIVFSVAFVIAVITMFIVPPNAAYVGYIDFRVLALLFCLMAVVEGFKKVGLFDVISYMILSKTQNSRLIGILLTFLCFFSAMLVTNDVALITFVPLTFILLGNNDDENEVIFIVVMETIAANLGSMVTPIGNPQNLYLYSYYNMEISDFFATVIPYGVISGIFILVVMWIKLKKATLDVDLVSRKIEDKVSLIKNIVLFVLCILVVLNKVDYRVCFGIILIVLAISDRKIITKIDYILLLTFVCFFVIVGNIGSIEVVKTIISGLIEGRTLLVGILLSQVISNVPAAIMLSGFTYDATELMLGVDIGGLGTLVASLASLISYKFYAQKYPKNSLKYMKSFTIYNVFFLIILLAAAMVM